MNPDYFVLTQIIIDDVAFPDGRRKDGQLGGGAYTAAGLRYWANKVGICSGIGPDFAGQYDEWFVQNAIDVAAAPRTQKCVHAAVNYFEDGEREELSLPGFGSHREMLPWPREIPPEYLSAKGMYIFKDCDTAYWEELRAFLLQNNILSVWEIMGDEGTLQNREEIARNFSCVDLFSLNLSEGKRMSGLEDPMDIIGYLHGLGAGPLILRMGAKGAIVTDKHATWHIPALPVPVMDVTGGGNSSTGGFLAGWCESGGDIAWAGRCAAVSASFIIGQYSVPPVISGAHMQAARKAAEGLAIQKL